MNKTQMLMKFVSNLSSNGVINVASYPTATSATAGLIKVDNTSILSSNGIISLIIPITGTGPKINSIEYQSGSTTSIAGGQTITINGSYFTATPTVYITSGIMVSSNDAIAPSVSFVSSTQITFTTPARSAGTYNVYVINPDGTTAIKVAGLIYV